MVPLKNEKAEWKAQDLYTPPFADYFSLHYNGCLGY